MNISKVKEKNLNSNPVSNIFTQFVKYFYIHELDFNEKQVYISDLLIHKKHGIFLVLK
jgi:hypothetical protein